MEYETLIDKLGDYITKLTIIKGILTNAPKWGLDAKIIIKDITHIDVEMLAKQLDNI